MHHNDIVRNLIARLNIRILLRAFRCVVSFSVEISERVSVLETRVSCSRRGRRDARRAEFHEGTKALEFGTSRERKKRKWMREVTSR